MTYKQVFTISLFIRPTCDNNSADFFLLLLNSTELNWTAWQRSSAVIYTPFESHDQCLMSQWSVHSRHFTIAYFSPITPLDFPIKPVFRTEIVKTVTLKCDCQFLGLMLWILYSLKLLLNIHYHVYYPLVLQNQSKFNIVYRIKSAAHNRLYYRFLHCKVLLKVTFK